MPGHRPVRRRWPARASPYSTPSRSDADRMAVTRSTSLYGACSTGYGLMPSAVSAASRCGSSSARVTGQPALPANTLPIWAHHRTRADERAAAQTARGQHVDAVQLLDVEQPEARLLGHPHRALDRLRRTRERSGRVGRTTLQHAHPLPCGREAGGDHGAAVAGANDDDVVHRPVCAARTHSNSSCAASSRSSSVTCLCGAERCATSSPEGRSAGTAPSPSRFA